MISFCLSVVIGIGYFGHCSHLEMSVQLCIFAVTLQQRSSQKAYEELDKLHPFLLHYCYINPTAIHGPVPSVCPVCPSVRPPTPFSILWSTEIAGVATYLPRDRVKPSRGGMIAGNFMWKAGTTVGATEQDLKIDDALSFSVLVPLVLLSPTIFFFLPCCHLLSKFIWPIFPFKSPPLFFFSPILSNLSLCLSASICHSTMWSLTSLQSPLPFWGVDIPKYFVGRGAQGQHAGEEFKFSYPRCLIFFQLFIYLLEQVVLGSCLESSFWQIQVLPLTFPSLTYLLFSSQPITSLLEASISVHLPVILMSSLDQAFPMWLRSFADRFCKWGSFSSCLSAGTPQQPCFCKS